MRNPRFTDPESSMRARIGPSSRLSGHSKTKLTLFDELPPLNMIESFVNDGESDVEGDLVLDPEGTGEAATSEEGEKGEPAPSAGIEVEVIDELSEAPDSPILARVSSRRSSMPARLSQSDDSRSEAERVSLSPRDPRDGRRVLVAARRASAMPSRSAARAPDPEQDFVATRV